MAGEQKRLMIEPLESRHDRAAFSCGIEALDRYLKHQARQDAKKNVATTFVLVQKSDPAILGFYTLSATSIGLTELPETITSKLPKYPRVPAILLGRLAVDQKQRGKKYGQLLLMDALIRCLGIKQIGWAALLVDAKDESAISFYEHMNFIRLSPTSSRLLLARNTIDYLIKNTR